jgi:hypothetical protein
VLGSVTVFTLAAAYASWPWWEYAFLSDDSPLSWLSSALLLANAVVALNLTLTGGLSAPVGSTLTAALTFLAIDEQFQVHERFKESRGGGTIGDLPTWLVGLGGIACVVVLRRTVASDAARNLLSVAVAVGLFAIWVDLGSPSQYLARCEEVVEVMAESLFLCGLLEQSSAHVQSGS